jgi:hypothetical protein
MTATTSDDNDNRPPPLAVAASAFENIDDMDDEIEDDSDQFDDAAEDISDTEVIDGMDEIEEEFDDDSFNNDDYSESTTSECASFLLTDERYYPPKKVAGATVDPSVKEMKYTFEGCKRLTSVMLSEGLERIGNSTFEGCELLQYINIPSSVKVIGGYAFCRCGRLESVELSEDLEELEGSAFSDCYSLQSITIPPKIKSINRAAFECCTALRYVSLNEGLEYIGDRAFASCPSLEYIEIPSTVKEICPDAFSYSRNLANVRFCDKMEEFVSGESFRGWWNNGVSKHALKTYSFFARCNFPARLDLLTPVKWQANIHRMLKRIPAVGFDALDGYFDSIDSMLTTYERLPDAIPLLELAVWKSKLLEIQDQKICDLSIMMKLQCRNECGAFVIMPNVLSFILDG